MKNRIRNILPRPIILGVRYIIYLPPVQYLICLLKDSLDLLLGRRDSLTPPTRLMFDGPPDIFTFKNNGEEYFQYFIKLGSLKPNDKILDVGCGIGRKVVPLTRYLDDNGRYEGFDIVKVGVDWCKKNISTKYPNFHFQLVDVFNRLYNSKGKYKASQYRFPFDNESFDFVVLGSVFTHMLPEDLENYLSEIARVMKRGGRSLISFFILNGESLELINANKSTLNFTDIMGIYRTINSTIIHENAVCYDNSYILGLYEKYGLKINEPIHYGSWCGRREYLSYQDIIVATKI